MAQQAHKTQYLKDYRASAYAIHWVEMDVFFAPDVTEIHTKLSINSAEEAVLGQPLTLDGEELELVDVQIDGVALAAESYVHDGAGLTLNNPPDCAFELRTVVRIKPEKNTKLMGLYRSNGVWTTQCEAEGFRRITFMLDRPDIMATYRVRMEADKILAPVLLSNGNLIESGEVGEGRHFAVWHDPHPKPTYLFAVVAGNLDHISDEFTTASGRQVDLAVYCEPGKAGKCAYAMDALKRSMKWDEERFGREYDLDVFNIVAVSDFNAGAMENKGLNIFNDKYILADPDSATDFDYYNIERIVAHEYFHNWTGNRVTCRDWFQLSLKEGLTVYRDQEFTSDVRSRAVKRIGDARSLRAGQFAEDASPLAHPPRPDNYAEIDNFFTSTVYNKGAEIVRMLATLLGREGFRKGTDLYFERYDGKATTIESWINTFEETSGRDLSHFIKWYTQAGTPAVGAAGMWNEQDQTYVLALTQHTEPTAGQFEKIPMYIPLKFGLVGPNGADIDYKSVSGGNVVGDVIVLDAPSAELQFEGVAVRPVLSILRAFSAPVILHNTQSDTDKLFLARHDSDPFNRWQASQGVANQMMVGVAKTNGEYDAQQVDALAEAMGESLASADLDNAFKALVLTLPAQSVISQTIGRNIDPTSVEGARRYLRAEISDRLFDQLRDVYERLENSGPASQDLAEVHTRELRIQVLSLLVAGQDERADAIAADHYYRANNMSDRMGGLSAIAQRWGVDALTHLDDFKQRFGQDMLAYDKWLGLVARAPDEDCLPRVKAIYESGEFPKTNPNRLFALFSNFTMGNVAQFARPDGKGFDFVCSVAETVDAINPQVSSSLVEAFRGWRTWEPNRGAKAEAALRKLADRKDNSRDLSDILARSLGSKK